MPKKKQKQEQAKMLAVNSGPTHRTFQKIREDVRKLEQSGPTKRDLIARGSSQTRFPITRKPFEVNSFQQQFTIDPSKNKFAQESYRADSK